VYFSIHLACPYLPNHKRRARFSFKNQLFPLAPPLLFLA
jgi:hypothetical protein